MQTRIQAVVVMPFALTLLALSSACDVGSISQTTAAAAQSNASSQQQASSNNTTGAVDPGATSTTGNSGTDAATTGATTAETTTSGEVTGATTGAASGTTTGGDTNTTTGQNGNTTTGQDGNATLFDISALTQAYCYYDTQKGVFALSLSNDAHFCTHSSSAVRMVQDHDLAITAELSPQPTSTIAEDGNTTEAPAQPKSAAAVLSLYSEKCALEAQGKSLVATVNLTQADSTGCTGSFTLTMEQTTPTIGLSPTTLSGSFDSAPSCAALTSTATRTKCR